MNKLISEQSLQEQTVQLNKELEPKRDLWLGIEKALATTAQQPVQQKTNVLPMAWAASVVAAVLLSWFSFSPQNDLNQTPDNLALMMQQDFEAQKKVVLTTFGQPELKKLPQDMQDQLKELSSARVAIDKALINDPNNSELLNLLHWTQQQEIELLKQLYSPTWQTI